MCTIGGITRLGRTYLFKNFDYPARPTGWSYFTAFNGEIPHFALVNHGQQGVNSGLNVTGLGLLISRSKPCEPSKESEELRTVLNAELLSRFSAVQPALEYAERYSAEHPEIYGGNLMLGDSSRVSVTEYADGRSRSEDTCDGYLARANHSVLGISENAAEGSIIRYERMIGFLEDLYPNMDRMSPEKIITAGRSLLRSGPILNENTRSSFVISVSELTVDYAVGQGPWQTFRFRGG